MTPSHRWDHHVNDGYKRPSNSGTSTPTVSLSWDGLRASKVAQELEKVSSYGYGAPGKWESILNHYSQLYLIEVLME